MSSNPCHGLCGSIRRNHSHCTLSASACRRRFFTPRPSKQVGLQIELHVPKHWLPLTRSFPAQKNAHIQPSMSSHTHPGAFITSNWCTGLAASTDLTSTSRLDLYNKPLCQARSSAELDLREVAIAPWWDAWWPAAAQDICTGIL